MILDETGTELAIGTGFVYEYEDHYYLITNGHCITGVNPETNKRISQHAGYPTSINLRLRYLIENSKLSEAEREAATKRGTLVAAMHPNTARVKLYQDDDCREPLWYIHPEHGYQVDVVAIPLLEKQKKPAHIIMLPLNLWAFEAEPEVADDVYILGYPFGITDALELPIWKRGSIATEPLISYNGLPKLLVDTATRPGMSGSPVILVRSGVHHLVDGEITPETMWGTIYGFVGVYSGRIGAQNEIDAQLGIVWRKEVIEEIIQAKVNGTIDFQNV